MPSTIQSQNSKRMQREYGSCTGKTCQTCCNLRNVSRSSQAKFCAAYGMDGKVWNTKCEACGLYNTPISTLPLRPLMEAYQKNATGCGEDQMALFR